MKILIVDNEKHVIDAIRMLIQWENFDIVQVFTALDGREATRIFEKENPEIVLTDMKMPNMDGMALVEWIRERSKQTQIVVISGYNDFNYIQHTLRHGGLDYITKPIDEKQLNEAIGKAVDKIQATRATQQFERKTKVWDGVYWEKMFAMVTDAYEQHLTELKIIQDEYKIPTACRVQLVSLKWEALPESLAVQFHADMNLFCFALKNVCQEVIDSKPVRAFIYQKEGDRDLIQMWFWNDLSGVETTVLAIYEALAKTFGTFFHLGLSRPYAFPEGLKWGDRESLLAISQRNLMDVRERIHPYIEGKSESRSYFHGIADELYLCLRGQNGDQLKQLITTLVQGLEDEGYFSEIALKALTQEYNMLKQYWMSKLFASEFNHVSLGTIMKPLEMPLYRSSKDLSRVQSELWQDLGRLLEAYATYEQEQNNPMAMIKQFIDEHYNEAISLKRLSERFYVSKEHLSRSFKKAFDQTLSDYITDLRLEKARTLLANDQLTLKTVAALVGYEDEKYFSKVFRQKYDQSPNAYRHRS